MESLKNLLLGGPIKPIEFQSECPLRHIKSVKEKKCSLCKNVCSRQIVNAGASLVEVTVRPEACWGLMGEPLSKTLGIKEAKPWDYNPNFLVLDKAVSRFVNILNSSQHIPFFVFAEILLNKGCTSDVMVTQTLTDSQINFQYWIEVNDAKLLVSQSPQ